MLIFMKWIVQSFLENSNLLNEIIKHSVCFFEQSFEEKMSFLKNKNFVSEDFLNNKRVDCSPS